ncbi:MAG: hypothetical protein LBT48_02650 [Prevotellaceae bacterium]|jgi:uncharacterized protein (TIGR02145 family)|nr:hypothetical protein [Prevotellaceae bacterium]
MKTNKILLLAMASVVAGSAFVACGGGDEVAPPIPKLSLKPATLSFEVAGGAGTVTISSNTNWAISGDASWVTLEPTSGSGTVSVNVTVPALAEGADDRSAEFTVTAGTATKTFTVNQTAVKEVGHLVGGVTWATRNVGEPGKFAADADATGKVYQFNTKKYYDPPQDVNNDSEASPSDWVDAYPGPGDWSKENDPCPVGWHVPTEAEFTTSLKVAGGVEGELGKLLGAAQEDLSAGDKTSDFLVYFPHVQQWASSYGDAQGNYKAQERTDEKGAATRYWTGSQWSGEIPDDGQGYYTGDISKANELMGVRMFAHGGGAWFGFNFEVGPSSDESPAGRWLENLNKANAYPVRCVQN